jgi:hypothetical protein
MSMKNPCVIVQPGTKADLNDSHLAQEETLVYLSFGFGVPGGIDVLTTREYILEKTEPTGTVVVGMTRNDAADPISTFPADPRSASQVERRC